MVYLYVHIGVCYVFVCVYATVYNSLSVWNLKVEAWSLNNNATQWFVDSQEKSDMYIVPYSLFPLDFCSAAHRATTATLQREMKGGGRRYSKRDGKTF